MAKLNVFRIGGLGCCGCNSAPTCLVTICVADCDGDAVAGAAVTIHVGGDTGDVTGTTAPVTGCVTLDVGTAGTYDTTISADGYQDYGGDLSYTCNSTTSVTLLSTDEDGCQITVVNCADNPVEGATVVINGGSYTTDSDGNASFTLPGPGSYPFSVTAPRYQGYSDTLTVDDPCFCPSTTVALTSADGYICCSFEIPACQPIPTTLHLTDSQYGGVELTYDPTDQLWKGTLDVSFPGGCGCPANGVTMYYYFNPCDVVGHAAGASVVTFSLNDGNTCPGNIDGGQSPTFSGGVDFCPPLQWTSHFTGCLCGEDGGCTGNSDTFVWRIYPDAATLVVTE